MSDTNKNDKGKDSLGARLLKPEFLTGIAAVIVAIGGIIAVVWPDIARVVFPTSTPAVSPPATPMPTVPLAATQTPTGAPIATHTPVPPSPRPSPELSPTPTTCVLGVDTQLSSAWDRGRLGCPTSDAVVVWAAWQPFERGYMLWRSDTRRVTVFYDSQTWTEFSDQWVEGEPYPSRGSPAPGLLAPVRGFGYIWSIHDHVFNRIGWALVEEKGFCAEIQRFERGFILGGRTVLSCEEDGRTRTTEPSFPTLLFAVCDDHAWQGEQT